MPLELIRQGQRRNVTIAIAERPTEEELARLNGIEQGNDEPPARTPTASRPTTESAGQRSTQQSLGLSVQPLTPEMARQLRLATPMRAGSSSARSIRTATPARRAFSPGDVILSINQTPTATPEAAASIVEAARRANRNTVLLQIRRGNGPPGYVGVELTRAAVTPPARRPG